MSNRRKTIEFDKQINVLQVGMSPYYGGTESFLMNQYRCINRSKIQFSFLNVYDTQIACQEEIVNLGGRIYYLDMARHKGVYAYYHNINTFFRENAKYFDIVHCNFQSLINVDILKYAKKYNIPVRIAHAHNAGYGTEPNIMQKMLIRKNKYVLHNSATHYFACSDLAAHWMFDRNATIIKNAIDVEKYVFNPRDRKIVRQALNLGDRPTIIFVGRLDPQKNPLFLIDIFREILYSWKNAQLLIVGDGILREQIKEKINQMGISGSVKMLGTRNDVNELLQAADIFLLPSKFEGLGIVLIEAQASGLRTFTSKDVVPKDVKITDLLEFISLKKNAKEWARLIISQGIAPHVVTKQKIIEAGYDNKSNANKLASMYMSFLGRG